MPEVSVVMSTYKTQISFLDSAINSILNQTFKNFEFIIVCDGDEEEYEYIKNKYCDSRIKLILHSKNEGLPKSLNEAIDSASCNFIARMDSDDIANKHRLARQYKYMKKHENIGMTSTLINIFGGKYGYPNYVFYSPEEIKLVLLFMCYIAHPSVMIRKDVLYKNNLKYNEEFLSAQDFELWSRLKEVTDIKLLNFIGLNYRKHDKQISIKKHEQQIQNAIKVIEYNSRKLFSQDSERAYRLLKYLSSFEDTYDANLNDVACDIEYIANNSNYSDSNTMKKVFYGYLFMLNKRKFIKNFHKLILKPKLGNIAFNFDNFIYCCRYIRFVIYNNFYRLNCNIK